MTIIIEISRPFQAQYGRFESDVCVRYYWLWFAVSILKVSAREYAETGYYWGDLDEARKSRNGV